MPDQKNATPSRTIILSEDDYKKALLVVCGKRMMCKVLDQCRNPYTLTWDGDIGANVYNAHGNHIGRVGSIQGKTDHTNYELTFIYN